ncbi:MAG: acyl-CoA dehydrogenase family protein [Spirochaetota bacterium]|nr:acyl-CoA dehydrogenase family protein [Spirochaetota bacterium]
MPLFLTDEQRSIKETIKRFTEKEIFPVRAKLDENEEYPESILKKLSLELGMGCPCIPQEYDGAGLGILESALIAEEISRGCLGVSTAYSVTGLGIYPILKHGSEELKKRFLPDVAKGRKTAAFALTESCAGSDIKSIQTTAVKKGDYYILNGVKQWITGASRSDIYVIFAITDRSRGIRGISCFVVEKDTNGLSFSANEKKLGIKCTETREVILDECKIPIQNVVGKLGHAFMYAMETFDHSRAVVAASAIGLSQGALEIALQYSTERVQFDNPISSLQAIQHLLADMSIKVESGRHLAYTAARMVDMNCPELSKYAAMAKCYCGENAFWIVNSAIQILGGYGYMKDYPLEKMLRDARILSIYEGTTEIQKNVIAHELIKERKRKKG